MLKLPPELVERRLKELEDNFNSTLSRLAERILNDCPEDKRNEHQSKTYFLVSAIYKEVCRRKESKQNLEFFVLGEERSIEKARAHMFSNSATGLFELGFVGKEAKGEGETEEKRAAAALIQNAAAKT
tara:strand:- start:133 stop:516 length:384 start_codon:yes stop_codon:yes gene_type:complete|eukprot:scaffold96011_cov63-Phaeocystis_antarctica.AAC.1